MTVEIFRDDAYARTTEAQILAVSDDGIVLDQTVFYPEGGGQPGDRGSIILGDDSAITIVDTHKNQAGMKRPIWLDCRPTGCKTGPQPPVISGSPREALIRRSPATPWQYWG